MTIINMSTSSVSVDIRDIRARDCSSYTSFYDPARGTHLTTIEIEVVSSSIDSEIVRRMHDKTGIARTSGGSPYVEEWGEEEDDKRYV